MSESGETSISNNRSALRDFLTSIATIRGDLSNITAPPFVLDTKSAVELPAFWAERPSVFCAAANAQDPAKRALLVLKWFLSSLRNQQYAGRDPASGVKKPLNAFLGELFIAHWEDDQCTTRLVSEQVSHHPPVTACRVWNEEQGVYAEGFTRQEITFNGSVNIQQIGHAILKLQKWDEKYLIPLPNVKVSGILTGTPYPELKGTYRIPSTNGYMSSIEFSGKSFFGSSDKKHSFEAKMYKEGDESHPLFTITGNWDSEFVIRDEQKGENIERFNVATAPVTELQTESIEHMDDWETRKAWRRVREALNNGNMQGTSDSKNEVEQGQRQMRKDEEKEGKTWERVFFKDVKADKTAENLASRIGDKIDAEATVGIWAFDEDAWDERRKPYHGELRPDNKQKREQTGEKEPQPQMTNGVAAATTRTHEPAVGQRQEPRSQKAGTMENTNDSVNPPMTPESQRKEAEEERLESGVADMTLKQQGAVEDMLRNRYSSG